MWFLTEIESMYKLSVREQVKICEEQNIRIGPAWGSDDKYLGLKVSDVDGEYLIKIAKCLMSGTPVFDRRKDE